MSTLGILSIPIGALENGAMEASRGRGQLARLYQLTPFKSESASGYLFPPITLLEDVMREHIAPGDQGDKNNSHQDGFDIFCRRRIDLVGGP